MFPSTTSGGGGLFGGQPGEDGESPMLEVQIMAITGDVFTVQADTVRNRCWHQQDMNCCVPGSSAGAAGTGGDACQRKGGAVL